jgi:putative membrane protein
MGNGDMIANWLIATLAVVVTAYLLPGVYVEGVLAAVVAALVLGIVNVFLKPIVVVLTLPINILTLGLFTFVINACLVLLTAMVVPGFGVDGFLWAAMFSLVLSIVHATMHIISNRRVW